MGSENTVISRITGEYWKKQQQNLQVWAVFVLLFLAFLGLGGIVSISVYNYLFKRNKTTSTHRYLYYGFGLFTSLVFVLIAAKARANTTTILLIWYGVQFVTPNGAGLMSLWKKVKWIFTEETADEKAERELERVAREQSAHTRRARAAARAQQTEHTGKLTLGVIETSENLPDNSPLSTDSNWLLLDEKVLNQHMFVLGAPGSGKTEFLKRLVVETLRSSERDVYVIDGKGEREFAQDLANLIFQYRKKSVPVFRFGFGEDELSSVYNGFLGRKDAIQNRLLALIGVEDMTGNAQYYADINRDLLQLICGIGNDHIEPPRSFEEVRDRCNKAWLQRSYTAAADRADIEALPNEAIEGLKWRLRHLVRDFSPYVDPSGFSLDTTTGAVFSINTLSVGDSAKALLNFFIEDIKDWIATRKDPHRPALLIIDEFGAFSNKNIIALLSLARSMGLGVVLATQDVASLSDETVRDRIFGNSVLKLIMRNDQSEDIAKLAGTKKNLLMTVQSKDGDTTGMGSARFEDIFKVHPNEVARLLPGQCFVVYNRYVAKIHSQMVGVVPRVSDAIRVYLKPTIAGASEQTATKQESPKKKTQRQTKKQEVTIFDKQDQPREKDEI